MQKEAHRSGGVWGVPVRTMVGFTRGPHMMDVMDSVLIWEQGLSCGLLVKGGR